MLRIEAQAHIHRPAHEVSAFLADFTHRPLWNYAINSVRQALREKSKMWSASPHTGKADAQSVLPARGEHYTPLTSQS